MRSPLASVVAGLRPAHWLKNLPVGAALLFGARAGDPRAARDVAIAFGCFCAVASAGYLGNDVADRREDALHPRRRLRPVAAGDLSPSAALAVAAVLAAGGLVSAALLLARAAFLPIAGYAVLAAAYTLVLRRRAALAVSAVVLGFLLRVLAGAGAARVAASAWLLALTALLAAALALGKRESEERRVRGSARPALEKTTDALLAAAALGYLAYALWPSTVALHGTRALAWTAVPVALALARFRQRLRAERDGRGPAEIVASDPALLALGGAWAASCAAVVYA